MSASTTVLPDFISALFWDTDPAAFDPVRHRDFILGRILSAGSMDAIRWARVEFGDDAIRNWIVRHEGRQLSSQQLRFWETVIGLPGDVVSAWIATPERRIWEGRGER
jgi:hypothetical protein